MSRTLHRTIRPQSFADREMSSQLWWQDMAHLESSLAPTYYHADWHMDRHTPTQMHLFDRANIFVRLLRWFIWIWWCCEINWLPSVVGNISFMLRLGHLYQTRNGRAATDDWQCWPNSMILRQSIERCSIHVVVSSANYTAMYNGTLTAIDVVEEEDYSCC